VQAALSDYTISAGRREFDQQIVKMNLSVTPQETLPFHIEVKK
jgi:hypothetical protein